jgi:hypothetical protein
MTWSNECFLCARNYDSGIGYWWTRLGEPDIVDDNRYRLCRECLRIDREELQLKLEEKILINL